MLRCDGQPKGLKDRCDGDIPLFNIGVDRLMLVRYRSPRPNSKFFEVMQHLEACGLNTDQRSQAEPARAFEV